MRHQITRLMMYNTLGYVKKSRQKNLKNFNQVRQKNIWGGFPKISSWTCFLPFLRCRTRWDRLKIVSTTRYIYKRFIFQNSPSPLSGGGGGLIWPPRAESRQNYWGGQDKKISSKIGVLMHLLWLFVVFWNYIVMKLNPRCRF